MLSRQLSSLAFALALLFVDHAFGQTATRLDRLSAEEYAQLKDKKGVVLIAVNWNRRWNCAGYENAQLRSLGFDRLPLTKATDDAPPDVLLDDAPLLLTSSGFDTYAFVVEPGEYAVSGFDIKVARSVRDVGGLKASRSHLIRGGKAFGGSFDLRASEVVYIGHFFIDCHRQPIPWRYYPDGPAAFKEFLEKLKSKFSAADVSKAQFKPLRTADFGNDYYLDAGRKAEVSRDWGLAEENYQRAFGEANRDSTPDSYRSMTMYNLGRAKGHLCKFDEAEKLLTEALKLEEKTSGPESGITTMRLFELARLHFDRNQFDKSAPYFERAMPLVAKLNVERNDPIAFASSYDEYAAALRAVGRNAEADSARKEAERIRNENPGRSAKFTPARYNQPCPVK